MKQKLSYFETFILNTMYDTIIIIFFIFLTEKKFKVKLLLTNNSFISKYHILVLLSRKNSKSKPVITFRKSIIAAKIFCLLLPKMLTHNRPGK